MDMMEFLYANRIFRKEHEIMRKRLIALLLALLMCVPTFALAEEDGADFASFYRIPDTLTYRGGVVMRGFLKGADATSQQIEVAYTSSPDPYIILNEETRWDFTITGGLAPYKCEVLIAYQTFAETGNSWAVPDWFDLEGSSFTYTFTEPGKYFIEVRVLDEDGQYCSFQTRPYETYTAANEADPTTVAGKVNAIIASVITPNMSEYQRALVLHDWLIYNADYDQTLTNRDADGVLLKGSGVCDSYARAYLMLCTAAGIECITVTGYAGEPHGWNMVNLDGDWYHVDCTWDDPVPGGDENHSYFLVDDDTLAKDHQWNRPGNIIDPLGFIAPEAKGGKYSQNQAATYDFTFADMDEFAANVDEMIASGLLKQQITGLYTGSVDYWNTFAAWGSAGGTLTLQEAGRISGYGYRGKQYYINLVWHDPAEYIDLASDRVQLSIGQTYNLTATDFYPAEDVFTWSSADPAVVTVAGSYDTEGPYAVLTGVSAGETTVKAVTPHGASTTVTVVVLPAFAPDFALSAATNASGVLLSWEAIPGVSEYTVVRVADGVETVLTTTAENEVQIPAAQLPAEVFQQIKIIGKRIVNGEAVFTYESEPVEYGKLTLTFTSTLPAAVVVIDAEAFANDTSLTSFKVPEGATTIGDRAFAGCTALTTVSIPASVTSMGDGVFTGCPIKYAQVAPGSVAEAYLMECFPNIKLVN